MLNEGPITIEYLVNESLEIIGNNNLSDIFQCIGLNLEHALALQFFLTVQDGYATKVALVQSISQL